MRVAVKGFKVEGFPLVEGNHFGKRSSMILTEHLALSVAQISQKKAKSGNGKQSQSADTVS